MSRPSPGRCHKLHRVRAADRGGLGRAGVAD
jgi:hypothetical protein